MGLRIEMYHYSLVCKLCISGECEKLKRSKILIIIESVQHEVEMMMFIKIGKVE